MTCELLLPPEWSCYRKDWLVDLKFLSPTDSYVVGCQWCKDDCGERLVLRCHKGTIDAHEKSDKHQKALEGFRNKNRFEGLLAKSGERAQAKRAETCSFRWEAAIDAWEKVADKRGRYTVISRAEEQAKKE